jgi:hypothetical protein
LKLDKKTIKKYILYLGRWQLSTPVLVAVNLLIGLVLPTTGIGAVVSAIIANFVGGLIFFWIDKKIFHH